MTTEFAPGLPSKETMHPIPKVEKPATWEFGVHHHLSEGPAKEHFDLRLGEPGTGHAHSWAMKYWPKPGETRLAIQQPTHTIKYMDFQGRIESGYGKGNVELARRDKTEIVSSSTGHVRFNVYDSKNIEEYLLRRTEDNNWLLKNITATRTAHPELPSSKPPYKVLDPAKVDVNNPNTVLQAKIDGAHVLYNFGERGRTADVYSYRPAERATGLIEHTQRLPNYYENKTPTALKNSILRGELYAVDDKGKALEPQRIGGILNANVWKSREKQKQEGKLVPVVFDVVKWRGKDVSNEPYAKKRELLEEAVKAAPWLQLPRTADTPEAKKKLFEDIQKRREPSTQEGVIEWHLDKPVPFKAKFREEHDVYIRKVFPEEGKRPGLAGGFQYSLTAKGPIAGKVGTGFSHEVKREMLADPKKYEGVKARVLMQRGHAGRAPAFVSFDLDQALPEAENKMHTREFQKSAMEAFLNEYLKVAFTTSEYAGPMGSAPFQQASQIPAFHAPSLKAPVEKAHQKVAGLSETEVKTLAKGFADRIRAAAGVKEASSLHSGKLPPVFSKEKGVIGRVGQLLSGERAHALKAYRGRVEGKAGQLAEKADRHASHGSPEYAGSLRRDAEVTGRAAKRIGKVHNAEAAKSTATRGGVVGAAGAGGFLAGKGSEEKSAAATTPAGRLVSTQRKGTGMGASVTGPSIASVAKPPGMGVPMPGALKNQI